MVCINHINDISIGSKMLLISFFANYFVGFGNFQ